MTLITSHTKLRKNIKCKGFMQERVKDKFETYAVASFTFGCMSVDQLKINKQSGFFYTSLNYHLKLH